MNPKEKEPAVKKKKWIVPVIGLCLIVLVLLPSLTALLLLGKPQTFTPPPMTFSEIAVSAKVLQEYYRKARPDRDGKKPESVELILSPEEINSLLNNIQSTQLIRKQYPWYASWNQGLMVRFSYPVKFLAVNGYIRILPAYKSGQLSLKVLECHAGHISVPEVWAENWLKDALNTSEIHDRIQMLQPFLIRLDCDGKNIKAVLKSM